MQQTKEKLLEALIDEGVIDSKEPLPERPPEDYHCSNCTCRRCNQHLEECVCGTNDILRAVEKAFSES